MEYIDKNYKYIELDNLIHSINRLREEKVDPKDVDYVKECLNNLLLNIFNIKASKCTNLYYTKNIDNIMFGIVVEPKIINPTEQIVLSDNNVAIPFYSVEIDSKLFDSDITDEEITALLLYNVLHLLKDNIAEQVSNIVTEYLTTHGKCINISPNMEAKMVLVDFGIIDAMIQLSSSLQITEADKIKNDPYLDELGLGPVLRFAIEKAYRQIPGCDSVVERQPLLYALDWCLRVHFDFEKERIIAARVLKKCIASTGSYIYKTWMKNVILAINSINTDTYIESAAMVSEGSLFANLKYNGLRGIENDLYEFMVRARNADTEDEIMYALKQINTRLSILDDYLNSTDSSNDRNYDRWMKVYEKYKAIRDEIAAKKVYNKRNYGIFIDYDKLDRDDNANGEDYSM